MNCAYAQSAIDCRLCGNFGFQKSHPDTHFSIFSLSKHTSCITLGSECVVKKSNRYYTADLIFRLRFLD